jgi:hypothetical protein
VTDDDDSDDHDDDGDEHYDVAYESFLPFE